MEYGLTHEGISDAFAQASDFVARPLRWGGQEVWAYFIDGLVSGDDMAQTVFKPFGEMPHGSMEDLIHWGKSGGSYNPVAERCQRLEQCVEKLLNGYCVVLFPGEGALAFEVKTPEKRGISPPTVEPTVKGPKDSFTESMRTNTGILRRHLRTSELGLWQTMLGSVSGTNVTVAWLPGAEEPARQVKARLETIQPEGFLTPGEVEEWVTGKRKTPFPMMQYTERGDKFAMGLRAGRVGILVDGLPLGYLLPVDVGYLMTSPEDLGMDYLSAGLIRLLRYGALGLSLLLPGCYVALAMFHQQMIPLPLLRAMVESKASVPFSTAGEVLGLLLAFELLQEAGLHLPQSVGQSVSIIGGIVVGTAAVEANLVSPGALIVVSLAGVSGFALPNRDFSEAIRLCRLGLTGLGMLAGLFGVTAGAVGLVIHLAGLTSLGKAYLAPFSWGKMPRILPKRPSEQGEA